MKTAVVLFNLGGPDKIENVESFLFNLFNDRAIIDLPNPFRKLLAKFISSRRKIKAEGIYNQIGGKSPILEFTQAQADALQASLGENYKVFICMRYWHPMSYQVSLDVAKYNPDKIVMLPLYPQYSTTTSASSFKDFKNQKPIQQFAIKEVNSYHLHPDFIDAHVDLIKPAVQNFPEARVLFSAHGLPEKVIKKGDPYQKQVEETSATVAAKLAIKDWKVCYQSKVGPLPWLKPNSSDEIELAGKEGKDVILVPISFVSEHSETLVELDIDFRKLAEEAGVPNYIRIPALGTHPQFIKALKDLSER